MDDTPANTTSKPEVTLNVEPERLLWLDPARITLRDPGNGTPVTMTMENDRSYLSIYALRAFPRYHPKGFIQIFEGHGHDASGEMVGMVRHLDDLEKNDRTILEETLRRSYQVPKIIAILDLKEERNLAYWVVETDRGVRSFEMFQPHRNVVVGGSGRVFMTDVDENRYEVANTAELDETSRQYIERVM